MAKKFKFIIVFLISMGFFSSVYAAQYTNNSILQSVTDSNIIIPNLEKDNDPPSEPPIKPLDDMPTPVNDDDDPEEPDPNEPAPK